MSTLQVRLVKALLGSVGRLSDGICIARTHGFTSGKMLDYIYRNRPSGLGPLGRLVDRAYLSHRGWQAVRIRKWHVEMLLDWAVCRRLDETGSVLVLDVASGQAQYLLNVLAGYAGRNVRAVCWDTDEHWLEEGQESAAEMGLGSVLYERGDALDAASYARLPEWPDVVIASGFYDWIGDDQQVRGSMALISRALAGGGYFLFTSMTGHVNLALTNGAFTGFDGRRLEMKTRPVDVVHDWAGQAGFDILLSKADPWGYHAVSLARRR